MMSRSSRLGRSSSSLPKRSSPPGALTTSYPFSLRIHVKVLTSDWSSSATRILAAGSGIGASVREQEGIEVAAAHHEHRGGDGVDGAGAYRGRGRGARRLHRAMAVLPEKMHRLAHPALPPPSPAGH